jgi:cytosine/creatinine deaminase
MVDLLLTNARVADDRDLTHIGITGSRITSVGSEPGEPADVVLDCAGDVVLPGLIESHLHLDKALLDRQEPNLLGTLDAAIAITGRLKASFTRDDVRARSIQVLEMAIANGTTFIRAHPDVDPIVGLLGVDVLLELRQEFRQYVDLQIVAFPQEGMLKAPGTDDLMRESLRQGADVVGGCPYNEASVEDARRHVDRVFDIAEEFGVPIDMHVDFADHAADARYTLAGYIADVTIERGHQGRVALGHVTALGAMAPEERARVVDRLREADITIVPLPATDMHLAGRSDQVNIRRGLAPVAELADAGVNVCYSTNNVRNAFTPYGRADLLEMGLFLAQTCHLSRPADMRRILDMVTHNAARNVGIGDRYGIRPGRQADLVVIGTKSLADVLLDHPADRVVIKSGRVVARTRTHSELLIPTTV